MSAMKYKIHIAGVVLILTEQQLTDLKSAIELHRDYGSRDGWTRLGSVSIIEVGCTPTLGPVVGLPSCHICKEVIVHLQMIEDDAEGRLVHTKCKIASEL